MEHREGDRDAAKKTYVGCDKCKFSICSTGNSVMSDENDDGSNGDGAAAAAAAASDSSNERGQY